MEDKEQTVSIVLKRLLKEKGISQSKLSRLSGVDRGYINQIVKGRVGTVTLRIAEALAKGLNEHPSNIRG